MDGAVTVGDTVVGYYIPDSLKRTRILYINRNQQLASAIKGFEVKILTAEEIATIKSNYLWSILGGMVAFCCLCVCRCYYEAILDTIWVRKLFLE